MYEQKPASVRDINKWH